MLPQAERRDFAGIPFVISTLEAAASNLCRFAKASHEGADVHLLNAYSISLAEKDRAFRDLLMAAAFNYPDGKPLSMLTKFSKQPLHQVRGPSLFELTMDIGRGSGIRHFLLGSTPDTLSRLKSSLESRFPGAQIVGTLSPPFRVLTPAELSKQDREMRQAEPDIIWVGLGTPKQDYEAQRLANESKFLAVAVGAAFDFSAGTKKEGPEWMRRLGLEWVYRLWSEPGRLWKRYLFGNIVFLWSSFFRRGKRQM